MGLKKVLSKFKKRLINSGHSKAVILPAWWLHDGTENVMVTLYENQAIIERAD